MHSLTSSSHRTSSLARMVVEFVLSKLINRHTKRIIFITSLYARVSRLEKLQKSAIERLNQLMVLATNEASLPFASRLQNVIWNKTGINEILSPEVMRTSRTPEEWQELSTRVVDMSPYCLRYDTKPKMIREVFSLLTQSAMPMAA